MINADKFLFWTSRILAILFILLLAFFSIDVFSLEQSLGSIVVGLIMHNIPVFALIVVLVISWRYEIVGGVCFILFGVSFLLNLIIHERKIYLSHLIIIVPPILIGILFLLSWVKKRYSAKFDTPTPR